MDLFPVGRNILIQKIDNEKTDGGIYIPTNAATPIQRGLVLSVGEQVEFNVVEDWQVFYYAESAVPIEHKGQKYYIIREADCLAVLELDDTNDEEPQVCNEDGRTPAETGEGYEERVREWRAEHLDEVRRAGVLLGQHEHAKAVLNAIDARVRLEQTRGKSNAE